MGKVVLYVYGKIQDKDSGLWTIDLAVHDVACQPGVRLEAKPGSMLTLVSNKSEIFPADGLFNLSVEPVSAK